MSNFRQYAALGIVTDLFGPQSWSHLRLFHEKHENGKQWQDRQELDWSGKWSQEGSSDELDRTIISMTSHYYILYT